MTHVVEELRNLQGAPLAPERLHRVKAAYTTRRIRLQGGPMLLRDDVTPRAGDLLLARVEALGHHSRLELNSGRRAHLYVGDEVLVCYAARYAPDQFEAYVPDDLGACDLVAAGGVAARCASRHKRMKKPTRLLPLGLLADAAGRRLNLADGALPAPRPAAHRPYTVAVVGTAMNAGKTTTAANLVRGLRAAGLRVAAAKVTGTGAGCDRWSLIDAGADSVLDFTDAGAASTFGLEPEEVERIFACLCAHLAAVGAEAVVLEVADGLYQTETAALLASRTFKTGVDGVVFAAGDALGARAGVEELHRQGLAVLAVSGVLSASPLACREAERATGLPVVTAQDLSNGVWLPEYRHCERARAETASIRPANRFAIARGAIGRRASAIA